MNNVKNDYNPLSIDHQLKNRLEKRASGVSLPESRPLQMGASLGSHSRTPLNEPESKDTDLESHFVNLMFNSGNSPAIQAEKLNTKIGTKHSFSPLKLQEESKNEMSTEKEPFCLLIETSSMGPLKLNGSWSNGVLRVHLQLPKQLDTSEKRVLMAILGKTLTQELGVQTEIEID